MAEQSASINGQAKPVTESLILASASRTRAALLREAGVRFEIAAARIDEEEVKLALLAERAGGNAVAETLAELKAMNVSRRHPGRLVLGADQVLECDGRLFDKPRDRGEARTQLQELRGRSHSLITCAVMCRDEHRLWHNTSQARLTVRAFSDAFLDEYLKAIGDTALWGPGAYQIEGLGAQIFAQVEGDYFTILGLPLVPVLDYLRTQKLLGT